MEQTGTKNAVDDLCGTPCQEVVDTSGVWSVCAITWSDGCGEETPPDGFSAESTVASLCGHACAFYSYTLESAKAAKAKAAAEANVNLRTDASTPHTRQADNSAATAGPF